MNILLLIGGLILILLGANGLTDGAASVAKRFRIPSIVIGLTIVAFGTSAPELTVSVASALKGSADIAIGNVVGSNIFNTLMIVGCTALFAPIVITRNTLRKEIPLCILSSVVLLICANDIFLDNATENILNRVDGLLLLCFFAIFMGYTFAIAFPKSSATPEPAEHAAVQEEEIKLLSWWKSILYIIGGLAALIYGGQLFVNGATGIARSMGVSESIIGLTLVAGGTSLPELATSIVAALKKNPEIAIGNVIGSNLFNIFFVLGCSASSPSPQRNYQLRFVHTGRFQHSALAVRTVLCQANDYTYRRRYYDTLLCGIYDGTDLQYVIRQTTLKKQKASGNYVRKPFIFRSKKKNLFHLSYRQNIHAILSISGNPPVRISISAMDSITRIISEPVRSVRYP